MSQQVSTAVLRCLPISTITYFFTGVNSSVTLSTHFVHTFLTLLLMQIMYTFLTLFMQTFRHEPSVYYITNRHRPLCTNYCIFHKITLFIFDLMQTTVHEI